MSTNNTNAIDIDASLTDNHLSSTAGLGLRALLSIVMAANGDQAVYLKRGLYLGVVTASLRGLAYVGFIPLFMALSDGLIAEAIWWAALMSALMVASAISDWFSRGFDYEGHAAIAGDRLRRHLGHQLRRIPLQRLYQQRTGELAATMAGDVDDVVNYTSTLALMMVHAVITPLATGLGALWFDWRLALVILLLFPLALPFYFYLLPKMSRNRHALLKANGELMAQTVEYTQGLAILKSTNSLNQQASKLNSAIEQVQQVQADNMRSEAIPSLLLASVIEIGVMVMVGLGLWLVTHGDIQLMILAGLMVSAIRFSEPLSSFMSMMGAFEMIRTGYLKLHEFGQIQPLTVHAPIGLPSEYKVSFEQVSFTYLDPLTLPAKAAKTVPETMTKVPRDQWVLNDVTLTIPSRAMTALVGTSGSGKTTLTRLLMRYDDPQQGRIKIGGVDIRRIPSSELNRMIAVVFQDVYLFDDSIRANIRMGRPDASDEDIVKAAKAALCHDFISRLPQGYDTRIGEIGSQLSGGEKQRLSIARALLKNAPIIILDEPTAALDTFSEIAVQKAIDVLVQDKTVIVIAHRLSSIMAAQNIVVLEAGQIVEQGTHRQLIEYHGRYAKLWAAQHASQLDFVI